MDKSPLLEAGLPKRPRYGASDDEKSIRNSNEFVIELRSSRDQPRSPYAGHCSDFKQRILEWFPVLTWLPKYTLEWAMADLIAGLTTGLVAIPQGIAYAMVADLPPEYGLYSGFMGSFLYFIFGTSPEITVGPTAILSLITSHYVQDGAGFAVILSFFSGVLMLLLGLLRLGFIVDFISKPVMAGFTSAAAITIASSKIHHLFGLQMKIETGFPGIIGVWADIGYNISSFQIPDALLGSGCLILILSMKFLTYIPCYDSTDRSVSVSRWGRLSIILRKCLAKILTVTAAARSAVVVILSALLAYILDVYSEEGDKPTFILTGTVKSGLPPFKPPPFTITDSDSGVEYGFIEVLKILGTAILIVPVLGVLLESIATAHIYAEGKPIDSDQEMIALGFCNILGSFVSAMPVTGSFCRTSVNAASGVKTQFGGIYTGLLVVFALAYLMPACAFIPRCTLGAVIITAVLGNIEYKLIKPIWKSNKLDLFPGVLTFLMCLLWALEYGVLFGVATHIVFQLCKVARPRIIIVEKAVNGLPYLVIIPEFELLYPAEKYVRYAIEKAALSQGKGRYPVILDCTHIISADFTIAKGFQTMLAEFEAREQPIIFLHPRLSVERTLRAVRPTKPFVAVFSEDALHRYIVALNIQ